MSPVLACLPWLTLLLAAPQAPEEKLSPAWGLWQQGQEALRQGETGKAIDFFEESLATDPKLSRNYLSLAACYLDKGSEAKACLYLTLYVAAHPEHRTVRLQYIDLLQRLKRLSDAQEELEHFIADAQEDSPPAGEQLVQCHSRLMQIGEQLEDYYEEHLQRGIGLFLLSSQRPLVGDDDDLPCPQGLLCKAAAELTLAARAKPEEARPQFYLHQVWSKLAQSHPAHRSLRSAAATSPFSYLSPAEHRQLQLASRQCEHETPRR